MESGDFFLELDDVELQGAEEHAGFVPEDEFVSTVFIKTQDGKAEAS